MPLTQGQHTALRAMYLGLLAVTCGGMAAMGASEEVIVTLAGTTLEFQTASDTNQRVQDALGLIQTEIENRNISGILRIENSFDPNIITHMDRRIVGSLNIVLEANASISAVQSAVDSAVASVMNNTANAGTFQGIDTIEDGFGAQFNDTFTQMGLALLIGLLLIYLVLVAIFQSFRKPFITLITVPLAFTGGFLLLWIVGLPLSIVGLVGLMVLMGVITNNGIVFVDYVNRAREDGLSVDEALVAAANVRTRPILMTAISTIFAMIPIALGFGTSGTMMQAMGIICIGGLIYGTAMTLLVTPAFYKIFSRDKKQPAVLTSPKK